MNCNIWLVPIVTIFFSGSSVGAQSFEGGATAGDQSDYATEIRRLQPLAEQGDARSQTALGSMYILGQGVPKNDVIGNAWFRKAAEQGNPIAQWNLGYAYDIGRGVPKDEVLAYMWLNLCAVDQHWYVGIDCARKRDEIAFDMTPSQIAEAQRLGRERKPGVR